MLSNYLKITFRSILKYKGYAAINLVGQALGLTTGILIMVYFQVLNTKILELEIF